MPIFYIILTIPLRSSWEKIFIIFISISIVVVSITNRAGILRILVSYSILLAVYLMQSLKVSKRLIQLLVVLVLMIPLVSLYMGIRGKSVFQIVLGEDDQPYSQLNPYADTRTFLYHEVFQDLKINRAFVFGKGLNATYESEAFQTFERPMVEVGFLQILMKTGIVGVLLYLLTIISAIFRALGRSNSH
jgi:O-antigen ligase